MSDGQIEYHFQRIKQQIMALQEDSPPDWEAIDAALEDLQVTYEQMQANSEAAEVLQEELLQQKQYYQDLFQFFPIASLVTDANGVILEANQAIAQLLNVSSSYLIGKSLAGFVRESDDPFRERRGNWATFQAHLNQLSHRAGTQIWRMSLCPRDCEPIVAEVHVAIARNRDGQTEHLRMGVYNLSQSQGTASVTERTSVDPLQRSLLDVVPTDLPRSPLPESLDGLQVLVVDDEADIREFITAVLETHGIGVRAVASATAALEELERFRPDVLLSDIRMPGENGYHLIRQIRALEAEKGGHLPAAAITAYLDEDREKSLQAGFEAHLYKLVQPGEWVEMVAQLANQASR
ncbi:response regulator [Oscillatoria sp. FACHB-1407]|uniref:response regulator n=1 Tax=Oscillatoria sp. FACHB-1407 TaxID=2692847 RepID=UPI0016873CA1|nr:response regulator [Oscillatoria sp. FACHB-1407]MBD2463606.1 response regulator [Oscillatoria sp. FACHB-1407]